MKLKLSQKDLLLVLGILVAAIIVFTTMMLSDSPAPETKTSGAPSQPKTGLNKLPSVIFEKAIKKVDLNARIKS